MTANHKRFTETVFSLGTPPIDYKCQITNWNIENNTADGDLVYTHCPDGEFREDADDDYALTFDFISDWQENGISDFFASNDGETVAFTIENHPDDPDWHVGWTGTCKIKAPNVGGEARQTERQSASFPIIGKPVYGRIEESG
jgi:hypothetical protein